MPGFDVLPAASHRLAILSGGELGGALTRAPLVPSQNAPIPPDTGPAADPAVQALVKAHPALGRLSEQGRSALLRWSRIRVHKRQDVVCRLGDPASNVVLILDGFAKLSVPLADGGEVFLDIAKPGDCINEMPVLQAREQDKNITALTHCRLLLIDGRQFRPAFEQHRDGLLAILHLANERLKRTTEQLMDSRGRTAPARLAKALLHLAALLPDGRGCLTLRLSQSELSFMAGMSREIVNKQLGAWRDAGWIEMSNGTVASIDVTALAQMVGGEPVCDADSRRRCLRSADRRVSDRAGVAAWAAVPLSGPMRATF